MSRDTGRRSVYVAEDAAYEGTPLVQTPGTETLAAALATLFESPWWRAHGIPVPAVKFRPGGHDGFVRFTDSPDGAPPRQPPVLLSLGSDAPWHVASHELAHVITLSDDTAHGTTFRAGHVAVAAAVFGDDCARILRRSYSQFGLIVADGPTTPPPAEPIWDRHIDWSPSFGGWRPPIEVTSRR